MEFSPIERVELRTAREDGSVCELNNYLANGRVVAVSDKTNNRMNGALQWKKMKKREEKKRREEKRKKERQQSEAEEMNSFEQQQPPPPLPITAIT